MKKALALLLAFAASFTLCAVVFADGMPEGMDGSALEERAADTDGDTTGDGEAAAPEQRAADTDNTDDDDDDDDDSAGANPEMDDNRLGMSPFSITGPDITVEGVGSYTIASGEMFYVWAEGSLAGQVALPGTILRPDEEYVFDIYYAGADVSTPAAPENFLTSAAGAKVTKGMLGGGRLRLRTVKGSTSIATAKIEEDGGSGNNLAYRLVVNTKPNYGAKLTDVQYDVEVSGFKPETPGYVALARSGVEWKVGFREMDDDVIESLTEDDVITISNDRPVITREQFETITRRFSYKPVTFENEDNTWRYTGRVSGMPDSNFYNREDFIESALENNPEANFKFLNFPAGVHFPTNGEMRIDVSDISDDFETIYLYLSREDKLTPITFTHDRETDEIVFRTNYLGTFIMSDRPITTVGTPEPTPTPTPEPEPQPQPPVDNNNNPGSGADPLAGLISTLGLASLAGGALVHKRK